MDKIEINHGEYQESLKSKSYHELLFIIKDAQEAAAAFPDGYKVGYYLDEVNYAAMELHKRRNN
jgi:hypothetical protein